MRAAKNIILCEMSYKPQEMTHNPLKKEWIEHLVGDRRRGSTPV